MILPCLRAVLYSLSALCLFVELQVSGQRTDFDLCQREAVKSSLLQLTSRPCCSAIGVADPTEPICPLGRCSLFPVRELGKWRVFLFVILGVGKVKYLVGLFFLLLTLTRNATTHWQVNSLLSSASGRYWGRGREGDPSLYCAQVPLHRAQQYSIRCVHQSAQRQLESV